MQCVRECPTCGMTSSTDLDDDVIASATEQGQLSVLMDFVEEQLGAMHNAVHHGGPMPGETVPL